MPRIRFVPSAFGAERVVDVPEGGSFMDACDASYAPIPFSCRSATCGTCQMRILSGGDCLLPPGEAEKELLSILRGAGTRLACQAELKPGPGEISVISVDG